MDEGEEIERLRTIMAHQRHIIVMYVIILIIGIAYFYLNASGILRLGSYVYAFNGLSADNGEFMFFVFLVAVGITSSAIRRHLCRRKIMLLEQRHREEGGGADDRDG